jgi:hypothetical protein
MAEVYRARETRLSREVAIKALPEDLANAGRIASKISAPDLKERARGTPGRSAHPACGDESFRLRDPAELEVRDSAAPRSTESL